MNDSIGLGCSKKASDIEGKVWRHIPTHLMCCKHGSEDSWLCFKGDSIHKLFAVYISLSIELIHQSSPLLDWSTSDVISGSCILFWICNVVFRFFFFNIFNDEWFHYCLTALFFLNLHHNSFLSLIWICRAFRCASVFASCGTLSSGIVFGPPSASASKQAPCIVPPEHHEATVSNDFTD